MTDVMKLVSEGNKSALSVLYQVPHWVAWFDLDYGGNHEEIFTAACPPEALHALENGIYQHVLEELFNQVIKTTTAAKLDTHIKNWNKYP